MKGRRGADDEFEYSAYSVHEAVIVGDVRAAHIALRKDPDASSRFNPNGLAPFHILVMHYGSPNFDQLLELLKSFNVDLRQPIKQYPHDTVLHLAVRYAKAAELDQLVQKLYSAGCQPLKTVKNDDLATPWDLAEDMGLSSFCERLNPGEVQETLENQLVQAVCLAKFDDIKELLGQGADVFRSDRDGNTILHQIASTLDAKNRVNGHVFSAIAVILMMGCDAYKPNKAKQTPVEIAEERQLFDVALLYRQADLTFESNEFQQSQTAPVVIDRWKKVIEAARANRQQQGQQKTPRTARQVTYADDAAQNRSDATKKQTREQRTVPPDQQPLLLAVKDATRFCSSLHDFKIFIAELIRLGANINLINENDGNNCLHYAVLSNQSGVVDLMMRLGVETKLKNKDGKTPLQLAQEKRYGAIEKLIRDYQEQKPLDDWGKLPDPRCIIL